MAGVKDADVKCGAFRWRLIQQGIYVRDMMRLNTSRRSSHCCYREYSHDVIYSGDNVVT